MIDNYTWAAIAMRGLTLLILLAVMVKQVNLLRPVTLFQWVKLLMLLLVVLMLGNAILSLVENFFRQDDGNLIPRVRHVSLIVNALSGLASAVALYVLYFKKDE